MKQMENRCGTAAMETAVAVTDGGECRYKISLDLSLFTISICATIGLIGLHMHFLVGMDFSP